MPLLLPQRQAVEPEVMGLERLRQLRLAVRLEVDAEQALAVAVQQSVVRWEHRVRCRLLHRIRRSWDSRQPESRCFWPARNSIPE